MNSSMRDQVKLDKMKDFMDCEDVASELSVVKSVILWDWTPGSDFFKHYLNIELISVVSRHFEKSYYFSGLGNRHVEFIN